MLDNYLNSLSIILANYLSAAGCHFILNRHIWEWSQSHLTLGKKANMRISQNVKLFL